MAGSRKKCPLKWGVHSWEVKNVGFICGWEQKTCLLKKVIHLWEVENLGFIYYIHM